MRSISSLLCLAAAALGGWVLAAAPASSDAATVVRLDVDGLVERAEWVLEGRVVDSRVIERPDGGLDTEFTLDLARDFLGAATGYRAVRVPGGIRPDGSGLAIPGLPRITPGEEVLLFLGESGADGRRLPVGLAQGKYSLLTDRDGIRRALRDGDATGLVGGGRSGNFGVHSLRYAELAADVEAAVNRRRAREGR